MNKTNILSILMGILCGVLMALIMLYMMIRISFSLKGLNAAAAVLLAMAAPLCFGFVRKMNLSASLCETAAVITSFLITCLYALAAGKPADLNAENTLLQEVLPVTSLLHGAALAAAVLWNRMTGRD